MKLSINKRFQKTVSKVGFGVNTLAVLFFFGMIFFSINSFGQDYERVDATISMYPHNFENAEQLSKFITRDFATDEDKVRGIYTWIIQNIAYEPDEYKQFDYKFTNYRERNDKEGKQRDKIINRTIQNGIAVCEGYAMLFEKLCGLQNINNYLVKGDTKSNFPDIGRAFDKNHMWNVAVIGGKNYLFDLTWGAGKFNGKFIKDPSYFYYKTPPELFIKSHYPEMQEDSFLMNPISRQEFANRPLIIEKNLLPEDIKKPKNGLLFEDDYFDVITFSIDNVNPEKITYSYGSETKTINKIEKLDNNVKFEVPLIIGGKNLIVYFDEKPALGYKID